MKKIVITGALGHIGSRLIRELPSIFPDSQFVLIDNLSTQRYSSLFNLPTAKYTFIEGDVLRLNLKELFSDANSVVHLAANTDATGSFNNAKEIELHNLEATKRVVEASISTNARLIFPSSSSVYQKQEDVGLLTKLNPKTPYAKTKLKEEEYIYSRAGETNLKFVIFRFATICGISTGMRFHTAVNKFCWQAATGVPITVWTSAIDQCRPYLDLKDAVLGVIHVIKNDIFTNTICNMATGNYTIREIISMIKNYVPTLSITTVDSPAMTENSFRLLSSQLSTTGFSFSGDINKCIQETLQLLGISKNIT